MFFDLIEIGIHESDEIFPSKLTITSLTDFLSPELVLFRLEKVTILHGSGFFL